MKPLKTTIVYSLLFLGGILALPFAVVTLIEKYLVGKVYIYQTCALCLSLIPGWPGNFVRGPFYWMVLDYFHPTATVAHGSYFSDRRARMEAGSGTGAYCIIGYAHIGPGVRLASRVSILSGLHDHGDTASYLKDGAGTKKCIEIGARAWLGEGCIVAADVGEEAIVSMGAVVTKPVPPRSMAMGNPARSLPLTRDASEKS